MTNVAGRTPSTRTYFDKNHDLVILNPVSYSFKTFRQTTRPFESLTFILFSLMQLYREVTQYKIGGCGELLLRSFPFN